MLNHSCRPNAIKVIHTLILRTRVSVFLDAHKCGLQLAVQLCACRSNTQVSSTKQLCSVFTDNPSHISLRLIYMFVFVCVCMHSCAVCVSTVELSGGH
jgi:hypothetical protein